MRGIEFYDLDSDFELESLEGTELVDYLTTEFKQFINSVCAEHKIKFFMNESDDLFMFGRMYYASALKTALESNIPEEDSTYQELRNTNIGIEKQYYLDIVVPKIINEVHDKFFTKGDNFASFVDRDEPSYQGTNSEFGLKWLHKINGAKEPNKMLDFIDSDILDEYSNLFKKTWINDYEDRIGTVYNTLAIREVRRQNDILSKIKSIPF